MILKMEAQYLKNSFVHLRLEYEQFLVCCLKTLEYK